MVERRPCPSREICDISVKIADLGNACWIVSRRLRIIMAIHGYFFRTDTLRKTFKLGNTVVWR